MQSLPISFDCLPLRCVSRLDPPLDLLPECQTQYARIRRALEVHGPHNSYYLSRGVCEFRLSSNPAVGTLVFAFEGTVLTNADDSRTQFCQLYVDLKEAACDWLTPPGLDWFRESVARAVAVEFDRYIAATGTTPSQRPRVAVMEGCETFGAYMAIGL